MSIVVGVDPGHRSASVLHLAAVLARSIGTGLVVVAVVPSSWPTTAGPADAEWQRYTRDNANHALDHAAAVIDGSVPAEYVLHEAPSARRGLVEVVEQRDATFVVVGSSTNGPVGRIALGSESDTLLHASPVPVAIAPRGYRSAEGARVGRVTAAYRGTGSSTELVLGAAEVAASMGAELRAASFAVVPRESGTSGAGFDAEQSIAGTWTADVRRQAQRVLSDVSALPDPPRIADTVIGVGDTWDASIGDVDWLPDELLVVGSSSLGPLARVFLGSRAAKIVRSSPVPVVVVPRGAIADRG
ncbi:universal stress protein [Microbacterium sp. ASV49]|uniref:Universal stress protein n=1 Tax=Microbacterium candidum TaxID=3041922 RepID=A0ABT7MV80_9MICO|nr:universal stress protein [Microbacterium sp. ASV49]MDL9978333.1 universal stress protein [Microbacterium sp. ASV49]